MPNKDKFFDLKDAEKLQSLNKKQLQNILRKQASKISGTKAELIKLVVAREERQNIFKVRGYSRNKRFYITLVDSIVAKRLRELLPALKSLSEEVDEQKREVNLLNLIMTDCWFLNLYLKKDAQFYNVTAPDGSCSFQLVTVMTNRAQRSIEHRDDFPKMPEIDFTDSNLSERISSWYNRAKNKLRKSNESLCQKIDIYLSHLKNKGEGIIKSCDWIGSEEFHYLVDGTECPMSIFTDVEAFDDNYLRLDADTRYPQRCKFFRYSQLEDITNFPNFAAIQECHSYPLPSSVPCHGEFIEAIHELANRLAALNPQIWSSVYSNKKRDAENVDLTQSPVLKTKRLKTTTKSPSETSSTISYSSTETSSKSSSTEKSEKTATAKVIVSLDNKSTCNSTNVLNRRVNIWYPDYGKHYLGTVVRHNRGKRGKKQFLVKYDEGSEAYLDLNTIKKYLL